MSETLTVDGIHCTIVRSKRRRTLQITIEVSSAVRVLVPSNCSREQIEQVIRSNLLWIHSHQPQQGLPPAQRRQPEYTSGEGFCYLGRKYRLLILKDEGGRHASPLRLVRGHFVLAQAELSRAAEHFVTWYTRHALEWMQPRVDRMVRRFGGPGVRVHIADLGDRWSRISTPGQLDFHWRTICLPVLAIEYVMAEVIVRQHRRPRSRLFREDMERLLPDHVERKQWLDQHGKDY